ncbi:MAG: hypothetical protein K5669_10380, partial [Lachnospiraceae bacterium]|nr:hypothetical protein [Lachnospiraceae bacterium]
MFKNFDKVFKFSFKNQAGTKGYKALTVILGLLFLLLPSIIMTIVSYNSVKDDTLKSCKAKTIFVASDLSEDASFWDSLKVIPENDYKNIEYIICSDVNDALLKAKDNTDSLVLTVTNNGRINVNIIVPENSAIEKSDAKNYLKFMEKYEDTFLTSLCGISGESAQALNTLSQYKTFTETGYKNNVSIAEDTLKNDELMRDQVMNIMKIAIPYGTIMLFYFILLSYGQTLAQSVVMEKESKLMDTMLVSV